jgi:hypothetical protein
MAHTKDIKDLKWLPNFDENGEMLFASCSEDGDTKIWTLEDVYSPVYVFSPTKARKVFFEINLLETLV